MLVRSKPSPSHSPLRPTNRSAVCALRSQRDRPRDRLFADDRAQAEAQNAQTVLVARVRRLMLNHKFVCLAGIHPQGRGNLVVCDPEVLVTGLEIPGVDGQLSVDEQARGTGRDQTELIVPRLFWPMSRTQARRIVHRRKAWCLVADEHEEALAGRLAMEGGTVEILAVEKFGFDLAYVERGDALIDRAEFVGHRHVGGDRITQRVERRHAIVRIDLRAAATHDLGGRGVGPDDRDGRSRFRGERQDAIVLEQHDALRAGAANERANFGTIVGALRRDDGVGESADAINQSQQADGSFAQRLRGDFAIAMGLEKLLAAIARGSRHLEIEPAVHGLGGRLGSGPVGHYEAVKTPFPLEDAVDHVRAFTDVGSVQPVIGCHDGPGLGAFHRSFERRHIDLAQRAFVDVGADRVALILRTRCR